MAVTITNRATVSYSANGVAGSAVSNLATTTLQGPLNITKASMESDYRANSRLTYILTLDNTASSPLTNVTVTDNLGTFSYQPDVSVPAVSVTPLSYVGPSRLYIDGTFSQLLTPAVSGDTITYTLPSIPANTTALIIYDVAANGNAPLTAESAITNTATAVATGFAEPVTATHTVTAASYADIRIIKSMTPDPVTEGSNLTYTFTIYNYGNTEADSVVLTDTFTPAPAAPLTVTVNGQEVPASDYTYAGGVFTLPAPAGTAITVPAATLTTGSTGAVTVSPGTTLITVTGII